MAKEYIERRAAYKFMFDIPNPNGAGEIEVISVDDLDSIPAADAIEELSKPRWITVIERLPEHEYGESASVLTVDLFGVMRVMYFDGGNWCWPSGEALTTMRVTPITHWMPLPEPPKEDE